MSMQSYDKWVDRIRSKYWNRLFATKIFRVASFLYALVIFADIYEYLFAFDEGNQLFIKLIGTWYKGLILTYMLIVMFQFFFTMDEMEEEKDNLYFVPKALSGWYIFRFFYLLFKKIKEPMYELFESLLQEIKDFFSLIFNLKFILAWLKKLKTKLRPKK